MPDESGAPGFKAGEVTVPFVPDRTAIDEALKEWEERVERIAERVGGVLDQIGQAAPGVEAAPAREADDEGTGGETLAELASDARKIRESLENEITPLLASILLQLQENLGGPVGG